MTEHVTVTAAEANRAFSKLLRQAQQGTRVTITSHGKPVAQLGPIDGDAAELEKRLKALERLRERWAKTEPVVVGPWTREELYERR